MKWFVRRIRKLFGYDDSFVVKIWINIPTQQKLQKPFRPKKRLEQLKLF